LVAWLLGCLVHFLPFIGSYQTWVTKPLVKEK